MTVELPTEKSGFTIQPEKIKALLYGPPKVGKSTFASELDPDHTLFLATEPGLGSLDVFALEVDSWERFLEIGQQLSKDKKHYTTIVVDTIDELYRMCMDHVCAELGVKYPGDLDYGKGWAAVSDEFRLRVGKLTNLGFGVWFISHERETEVKQKVGTKTVMSPSLSGQARNFLVGFVDFIFRATWEGDEEGSTRVLRTQGGENHEAGGRLPKKAQLTDPLPLDAAALRKEMADVLTPPKKEKAAKAAKPEEEK